MFKIRIKPFMLHQKGFEIDAACNRCVTLTKEYDVNWVIIGGLVGFGGGFTYPAVVATLICARRSRLIEYAIPFAQRCGNPFFIRKGSSRSRKPAVRPPALFSERFIYKNSAEMGFPTVYDGKVEVLSLCMLFFYFCPVLRLREPKICYGSCGYLDDYFSCQICLSG